MMSSDVPYSSLLISPVFKASNKVAIGGHIGNPLKRPSRIIISDVQALVTRATCSILWNFEYLLEISLIY